MISDGLAGALEMIGLVESLREAFRACDWSLAKRMDCKFKPDGSEVIGELRFDYHKGPQECACELISFKLVWFFCLLGPFPLDRRRWSFLASRGRRLNRRRKASALIWLELRVDARKEGAPIDKNFEGAGLGRCSQCSFGSRDSTRLALERPRLWLQKYHDLRFAEAVLWRISRLAMICASTWSWWSCAACTWAWACAWILAARRGRAPGSIPGSDPIRVGIGRDVIGACLRARNVEFISILLIILSESLSLSQSVVLVSLVWIYVCLSQFYFSIRGKKRKSIKWSDKRAG